MVLIFWYVRRDYVADGETMTTELTDFEQNMRREIDAFLKPEKRTEQKPAQPKVKDAARPDPEGQPAESFKTGHIVKLAVRKKQLEMDTVFEHVSSSISRLEAQLEAEKAARRAGYPIIGYVIETRRL
ncbi:hypothetical protein QLQ85_02530 [Halomonas sp. M4R5S39]|uniref:hypothetical protein n=1 Tax=Halomonas kalidii TaxID=3043293 RepID=UPI0024A930FA|nr:hypothetical protein [Halomonas kalidii]MDI5983651.1 hypothetical protein [Halomonas kalidii]